MQLLNVLSARPESGFAAAENEPALVLGSQDLGGRSFMYDDFRSRGN